MLIAIIPLNNYGDMMMYSNINLDLKVLGRVALAIKALPAYACYHYMLPQALRAVDYLPGEVEAIISMYNYYKTHDPKDDECTRPETNCPLGYDYCSGCGRCEWL